MSPTSTPLPVLPFPSTLPHAPFVVLGHHEEEAVRVLRVITHHQKGQPTPLPAAFVARKTRDRQGMFSPLTGDPAHRLFLSSFGDGTFFLSAAVPGGLCVFPEPFALPGAANAHLTLARLTPPQQRAIHATILLAPGLAWTSADLKVKGLHWPRWHALNGAQAALSLGLFPDRGVLEGAFFRVVHAIEAPPNPVWKPDQQPHVPFMIMGRTLTIEGFGPLSVSVGTHTLRQANPDWVARVERMATAVLGDPILLPPLASICQTTSPNGVTPAKVFVGTITLTPLSAHQRLLYAASMPSSLHHT